MALHICNVLKPNSKSNTHFSFDINGAQVPDTTRNIEIIMQDLKPHIGNLTSLSWKGKRIKVFICGDYWFLSKLYDISGPCGFCPYLWCQKVKHKMQLQEAEPAQERSVQSLVELQQFLAEQRRHKECQGLLQCYQFTSARHRHSPCCSSIFTYSSPSCEAPHISGAGCHSD